MRQRGAALDQEWVYDALFASHSNYVHPSWHELRTFHLSTADRKVQLDLTYGGITPIGAYVVARLVAEACAAAAKFLPCDLDPEDTIARVEDTVRGSRMLTVAFTDFIARGGIDEDLARHSL
jgi:hypothetical protein